MRQRPSKRRPRKRFKPSKRPEPAEVKDWTYWFLHAVFSIGYTGAILGETCSLMPGAIQESSSGRVILYLPIISFGVALLFVVWLGCGEIKHRSETSRRLRELAALQREADSEKRQR